MSFSQEQKADIINQPIKTVCCRRALLQGVLSARGSICDGLICLSVDGKDLIGYLETLIFEVYSQKPTVATSSSGGRRKIVSFKSKSAEKYLLSLNGNGDYCTEKCPMCKSAFLKGVFLVSGRVCDPSKQYLLEFCVGDKTNEFVSIFESAGLNPKVSKKEKETVIYFKNSSMIEDFFALANMNNAAFEIMNMKIQGELRNTANRIANCETNNIDRAVSASMHQIALINELISRGLISLLPDELAVTARFRIEHQDMSLSQMAGSITPPISKSGLAHRLKKITEMAEAIINGRRDEI